MNEQVTFTNQQLEYLQKLFPDLVLPPSASEATLRYYFGQRSVLQAIKEKTRGICPYNPKTDRNGIPTPGPAPD